MTGDAAPAAAETIAIRDACPDDAPAILALQRAVYRSVAAQYDTPDLPPLTETVRDVCAAFATHTIIVAEHGGPRDSDRVLVGSVRARIVG